MKVLYTLIGSFLSFFFWRLKKNFVISQPLYLHFSLHHYLNLKVDMNKITLMMAAVLTLALTACGRSSSARSPLGDEGDTSASMEIQPH